MPIPRSKPEIHAFDYGTVFEFEVRNGIKGGLDLSEALAIEVVFMRPDGTSFAQPAQLLPSSESGSPDGIDGVIFYVIQPGDLDVPGNWFVQLYIELDGGAWNSSVSHFVVYPNLVGFSSEVLNP